MSPLSRYPTEEAHKRILYQQSFFLFLFLSFTHSLSFSLSKSFDTFDLFPTVVAKEVAALGYTSRIRTGSSKSAEAQHFVRKNWKSINYITSRKEGEKQVELLFVYNFNDKKVNETRLITVITLTHKCLLRFSSARLLFYKCGTHQCVSREYTFDKL